MDVKFDKDIRGWITVEIPGHDVHNPGVLRQILQLRTINKDVELVQQATTLRVYVDPAADKPDEWEVPAGSGKVFWVYSPQRKEGVPARDGRRTKIGPRRVEDGVPAGFMMGGSAASSSVADDAPEGFSDLSDPRDGPGEEAPMPLSDK